MAQNGRFGPYVKCGGGNPLLARRVSPLDVTLEQALELLAQPKVRGGRGASKEPLQVFDASPVTGQPVRLLQGRYGPYVTDGVTNASLPRDMNPAEVTFPFAVNLLKERAEAGPSKRATRKKSPAKRAKKPAVKAAAKTAGKAKKPAKKRTTRKKTSPLPPGEG